MAPARRILVTGAGGFIGSHLVERLVRDGHRVRAFVHYNSAGQWHHLEHVAPEVRAGLEILAGDITDPFVVERAVAGQELVFHLAALIAIPHSYSAPASYVATNVAGTLNVLQASRAQRVARLVHTSTSEVYGTAQYLPIDERHPLVAQSPYAASKIAADKLVESFHRSYGLPVVTVRPFNTYGPRQSARAVIPAIVCQALTCDNVRLGNQAALRDWTYVDDTVAGFVAAAQCEAAVGEVVNLGTGTGREIADIARLVLRLVGHQGPVVTEEARLRPPASEVERLVCDNRKAQELLQWRPEVNFEVGLARVIEYIRGHPHEYKPEAYNV